MGQSTNKCESVGDLAHFAGHEWCTALKDLHGSHSIASAVADSSPQVPAWLFIASKDMLLVLGGKLLGLGNQPPTFLRVTLPLVMSLTVPTQNVLLRLVLHYALLLQGFFW